MWYLDIAIDSFIPPQRHRVRKNSSKQVSQQGISHREQRSHLLSLALRHRGFVCGLFYMWWELCARGQCHCDCNLYLDVRACVRRANETRGSSHLVGKILDLYRRRDCVWRDHPSYLDMRREERKRWETVRVSGYTCMAFPSTSVPLGISGTFQLLSSTAIETETLRWWLGQVCLSIESGQQCFNGWIHLILLNRRKSSRVCLHDMKLPSISWILTKWHGKHIVYT